MSSDIQTGCINGKVGVSETKQNKGCAPISSEVFGCYSMEVLVVYVNLVVAIAVSDLSFVNDNLNGLRRKLYSYMLVMWLKLQRRMWGNRQLVATVFFLFLCSNLLC